MFQQKFYHNLKPRLGHINSKRKNKQRRKHKKIFSKFQSAKLLLKRLPGVSFFRLNQFKKRVQFPRRTFISSFFNPFLKKQKQTQQNLALYFSYLKNLKKN